MERPALMEAVARVATQGVATGGKLTVDLDKALREKELQLREEEMRSSKGFKKTP